MVVTFGAGGIMQKSTTIDFLPAASVLYIVGFWHALGYTTAVPGYPNAITHRVTVVILGLFVFLSGFLLANKDVSSFESIVTFYKRRLFRIWPLYILSLIVFVLSGLTSSKTALLSAVGISMFYGEQPMTL
jgi:peptidoglycan/LPS O-acetylase OafA/YrhL